VRERSQHLTERLVHWGAKAVVVACNTATAAAIHELRARWPGLPLVGVEPALKPAAGLTHWPHRRAGHTRHPGEPEIQAPAGPAGPGAAYPCQPCDGLADAIEHFDEALIGRLCERYLARSGPWGLGPQQTDTLVLGCTHYPLVLDRFQAALGAALTVLDTGAPVAQQTRRLLQAAAALRPPARPARCAGTAAARPSSWTGPSCTGCTGHAPTARRLPD
jgi:glutamate racemase